MKTIQASEMTDELWKSFASSRNILNKEIYTEKWNGEDPDWQELKNNSLKTIDGSDDSFSNVYYLFSENEAIAFIEATKRFGNLYFDFDYFKKIITEDDIAIVLKEIYALMQERNISNAFFSTSYERLYQPFVTAGIEVYDETDTSRLLKSDIDFSNLQKIIDRSKFAQGYNLKLFHEIPESIYERFVKHMNEITIDSNSYHPKKKVAKEYTMKDLLVRAEDIKDDSCPYYMYVLFDESNIAAHCSVFIDTDINTNNHWIDHEGAGYTAAGRNYRGKNLAKYLKAKMYLKIQEDFPDYEYILTDTLPWNKYMYRINEEFGFKPFQKGYTFRFTKDLLEKLVN